MVSEIDKRISTTPFARMRKESEKRLFFYCSETKHLKIGLGVIQLSLTAKQEAYVRELVNGLSQRQAYKKAFNTSNMKDETIDNKASKLFKDNEIRARYKELQDELNKESIMTASERMKWLSDVVAGNLKTDEDRKAYVVMSDRLKALDILNKMSGEYTTKVEADVKTEFKVTLDD